MRDRVKSVEVLVVEASGSRDSAKPILRLPERNDEDTAWTCADGSRPASGRNKVKSEDITRVRKRKELLSKEVAKVSSPILWTDGCGTMSDTDMGQLCRNLSTVENVFGQAQVGTNAG